MRLIFSFVPHCTAVFLHFASRPKSSFLFAFFSQCLLDGFNEGEPVSCIISFFFLSVFPFFFFSQPSRQASSSLSCFYSMKEWEREKIWAVLRFSITLCGLCDYMHIIFPVSSFFLPSTLCLLFPSDSLLRSFHSWGFFKFSEDKTQERNRLTQRSIALRKESDKEHTINSSLKY